VGAGGGGGTIGMGTVNILQRKMQRKMAEREGFEPSTQLLAV
jgi:hypothetical protein